LSGESKRYILIINEKNDSNKENFTIPCHGNATTTHAVTKPYLRTEKKVAEDIRNTLSEPKQVYSNLVKASSPFTCSSQSGLPRNLKQVGYTVYSFLQALFTFSELRTFGCMRRCMRDIS